ncbi:hypothetical protein [Tabrizicola sp.]|jgi:hypothetical protein|uniref:hypothetical protein n=1 Tax=Tabrizicola sp. TaxID=2005166 RepID=UPI0025EBA68F|nr:hypothetical protein [Tabrizicola sp.]MBY0349494.1 hypothetical protein [Tabrizicola sp.]
MRTYYVSFVIRDDPTYTDRYNTLIKSLQDLSPGRWWAETTSFIIFESDLGTDAIVAVIEDAINVAKDIAILGATDFKVMKVIGASKDADIYKLVDFAKKA